MWVWGTPVEMDIDGSKVSVLYLDTEGFESVGKSNVYDDRSVRRNGSQKYFSFTFAAMLRSPMLLASFSCGRIFALATVLSSVLIYNLPETVISLSTLTHECTHLFICVCLNFCLL